MTLVYRPVLHKAISLKAFPAAVLAGFLVMGAASAKAAQGSLAFGDGVTGFSLPEIPVPGDMITGTFNPGPNSQALVTSASGIFIPPFSEAPPSYFSPTIPTDWKFTFGSGSDDCGPVLLDCLISTEDQVLFEFVNGTKFGLRQSIIDFTVLVGPNGGSLALLPSPSDWFVTIPGVNPPIVVTDGSLTINETSPPSGGSYSAAFEVETQSVPVPLPILGAGMAYGYSRKVRRRIKLGQTA